MAGSEHDHAAPTGNGAATNRRDRRIVAVVAMSIGGLLAAGLWWVGPLQHRLNYDEGAYFSAGAL
ncbi:MAG: hypothetical protein ACKOYM_04855, partial [Actinomycetes bacterium]